MYVSIRDCFVVNEDFSSPVEGMRTLELEAMEVELTPDFMVFAMDSRERIKLDSASDARAYKQKLDDLGLKAVAFLTYRDFSVGDIKESSEWVARALELAYAMDMAAIRIDSAMSREAELDFGVRVDLFSEGLGGALEKAQGCPVALGIENHGYQGNNLAFLLNVIKNVNDDRLGLTMDTGNFYWRGYPLSEVYGILEIMAPHAKHTHLKNIAYPAELRETTREGGWEYGKYVSSLEEGDIDHARVIKILARAGYTGDICVEDESVGKHETPEARIALLKRDVDYVKGLVFGAE